VLLPGRIPDIDFRGNDSPKAILANINAQFSTNRVGDPCYCCEISAFAALLVKEGLSWKINPAQTPQPAAKKAHTPVKNALALTAKSFKMTATRLDP